MMDLREKRILVTGGAAGIGAATVRHFAAKGARVAVADMAVDAGKALVAELGAAHLFLPLNVADSADWDTAARTLDNAFGGLDIAFLNAGVMSRPSGAPILDDVWTWLGPESLEKNLAVNLHGVVHGVNALVPLMGDGGTIIATASAAALDLNKLDPFYAASKAAVIAYIRSMAPILAPRGIRIASLCPVGVETAMTPTDLRDPTGTSRRATPEDLAAAVAMMLDQAQSGEAWVAGVPGLAYRHEFTPLRGFQSAALGDHK